jgi:sulfite reductase beta subunit-like hemoprotein
MNKTETSFAAHLQHLQLAGKIEAWGFEPFRLRLGDDWKSSYTPDFMVQLNSGELVLVEVKPAKKDKRTGKWIAYWQEGAPDKFKWAKQRFPMFHFEAVRPWGSIMEESLTTKRKDSLLPNNPWVNITL